MKDKLKVLSLELLDANITIGTAEHCTSGLLGASISSMCGVSSVYKGTIVAVDEERLEKLLDVSHNALTNNGLVSSQVACQMAIGGAYALNVDVCVAIVGDVNPNDGNENHIVWICVATRQEKKVDFKYKKINVNGLRGQNIETAINEALDVTLEEITRITSEE